MQLSHKIRTCQYGFNTVRVLAISIKMGWSQELQSYSKKPTVEFSMQQLTLLLANSNPIPSMHTWSRPPCPDFMSWTGNSPPSSGPRIYNIYKRHYMFYLVSKNWSHFYILKEELACIFKGSNLYNPSIKAENLLHILMHVYE